MCVGHKDTCNVEVDSIVDEAIRGSRNPFPHRLRSKPIERCFLPHIAEEDDFDGGIRRDEGRIHSITGEALTIVSREHACCCDEDRSCPLCCTQLKTGDILVIYNEFTLRLSSLSAAELGLKA